MAAVIVALGAGEWLISSVGSFMLVQSTYLVALVVTLGTGEWFIPRVSSLMGLQRTLLCECFVTIAAKESSGISIHGCTTECEIETEMKM